MNTKMSNLLKDTTFKPDELHMFDKLVLAAEIDDDLKRRLLEIPSMFERTQRENASLLKALDEFRGKLSGKFIKADFYDLILEQVANNVSVNASWSDLMLIMKLSNPELEEKFAEVLYKDRNTQMNDYNEKE